jgi:hypothetical protein
MAYIKLTPYDTATIATANTLVVEWFDTTVKDRYKKQLFKKSAVAAIRQKSLNQEVDLYLYGNIEIEVEFDPSIEIGGVSPTDVDDLFNLLNTAIFGTKYTP